MRIGTNKGKMYSVSTKGFFKKLVNYIKPYLKELVRWFIKFIYIQVDRLHKYLIKKIENWEIY